MNVNVIKDVSSWNQLFIKLVADVWNSNNNECKHTKRCTSRVSRRRVCKPEPVIVKTGRG